MNELHIIMNKTAKGGQANAVWQEIKGYLKAEEVSYEVHPTTYPGAAKDIAEELSGLNEERVYMVVIGGDGTMNEALNGIRDFDKVRFGIIPAGSGNDFARGVGVKYSSNKECLDAILESRKRDLEGEALMRMDIGRVTWGKGSKKSRLFGISSGVGMDAIVCKRALTSRLKKILNRIHLGQLTYLLLTVHTLFSMETASMKLRVNKETEAKQIKKTIFAAAMNLRAEGGGVPMAPNASPFDKKLALCLAHGIPKWRTFFCLPILVMAKHEHLKGFDVMTEDSYRLHLDQDMTLHADGEYCGEVRDVQFQCLPGTLQILGISK